MNSSTPLRDSSALTHPWVLLPGWGMSAASFNLFLEKAPPSLSFHCLDWPDEAELWREAEAGHLAPLCEALLAQHPEPAYWLGWSLGGLLLGQLLQSPVHSRSILGAAFLGVGPQFTAQPPLNWGLRRAELLAYTRNFRRDPDTAWQHFLSWQSSGEPEPLACAQHFSGLSQGPALLSTPLLLTGLQLLQKLNHEELLSNPPCPLFFVRGETDPLCPSWEPLAQRYSSTQLTWATLPQAGHVAQWSAAGPLHALLQSWREKVESHG